MNVQALDRPWLKSFPNLRDVQFSHKAGPINFILGVQYSHLHAEEEVRQGLPFQAVAKRKRLGCHMIGTNKANGDLQICSLSLVQKINMERFYAFETLGVQAPSCSCPKTTMTKEDRMAMELFEASCAKRRKPLCHRFTMEKGSQPSSQQLRISRTTTGVPGTKFVQK